MAESGGRAGVTTPDIAAYKMFGDDAWIMPAPEGVEGFSAWKFAESMANELRG